MRSKRQLAAGLQHGRAGLRAQERADPEGVKEIPIRKIGGDRIEIILPQASNEEVEEVKKMLTDVGALEFRILANRKHDQEVIDRALGPAGCPSRRRGTCGRDSARSRPGRTRPSTGETLTDLQQSWKKDLYAGTEVVLNGKDRCGKESSEAVKVGGTRPTR